MNGSGIGVINGDIWAWCWNGVDVTPAAILLDVFVTSAWFGLLSGVCSLITGGNNGGIRMWVSPGIYNLLNGSVNVAWVIIWFDISKEVSGGFGSSDFIWWIKIWASLLPSHISSIAIAWWRWSCSFCSFLHTTDGAKWCDVDPLASKYCEILRYLQSHSIDENFNHDLGGYPRGGALMISQ